MAKPALGRGLGALLGGAVTAVKSAAGSVTPAETTTAAASTPPAPAPAGEMVRLVPLNRVHPSPLQPRKDFDAQALKELADSIKEKGVVQPLLVRENKGLYELIAGERRWRASQLAGLTEVPVIIREANDEDVLELALIENLQRENLNPIEEALGYRQLIEQFKLSQEAAATKVGKSRVDVANCLRLLNLPAIVQTSLRENRLSVGHAKVILGLPTSDQQTQAAEQIIKGGMTVRQTEELVSNWLLNKPEPVTVKSNAPAPTRDAHVVAVENRIRERLGTKVGLRYRQGKGSLDIRFYSDDELERILQILGISMD